MNHLSYIENMIVGFVFAWCVWIWLKRSWQENIRGFLTACVAMPVVFLWFVIIFFVYHWLLWRANKAEEQGVDDTAD